MIFERENEAKVISEFLKSIGPWNKHIVIGGGYAPIIYQLYLAKQKSGNPPVGTRDIDSLIPRKVKDAPHKNIAKHLDEAGFEHIFKDYKSPATEAYIKEINGVEVELEFLTDDNSRKDKNKNVQVAGVVAQPLSYLQLSLHKHRKFKTESGEWGLVVCPGAWVYHKGLTFLKRKSEFKKYKDLYGIWYVTTQLNDFSNEAIAELDLLAHEYPKWFQTFQGNLNQCIEDLAPIDWSKLETQDPFGKLKKTSFLQLVRRLTKS